MSEEPRRAGPRIGSSPEGEGFTLPGFVKVGFRWYLYSVLGAVALLGVGFVLGRVFGVPLGRWKTPAKADKAAAAAAGQVVEDGAAKGRRKKTLKAYARLLGKAADAASRGRDLRRVDRKMKDVLKLVDAGEYKLAEQLISELDYYLTDFPPAAGSSTPTSTANP